MRPDHRYCTVATIGYNLPVKRGDKEYSVKYGASKIIPKSDEELLNPHKSVSVGRVKSYGSITAILNSAGVGASGSPCINELGYVWGFMTGSHNDVPMRNKDLEAELLNKHFEM